MNYTIGYAVFQEEYPVDLAQIETIQCEGFHFIALFPLKEDAEEHIRRTQKKLHYKQYIREIDLSRINV